MKQPEDNRAVRPQGEGVLRGGLYYIRNSTEMKRPGRNDPCYCGSNKKYKKCHWGERSRFRTVYIGHHTQFDGLQFEEGMYVYVKLSSGLYVLADHVVTVTEAENPDGTRKVLNVISDKFAMRLPLYLANNYDVVYAIDTNTKEIGGDRISVTCVVESRFAFDGGETVAVNHRFHGVMLYKNCRPGHEEKFGWWKLLTVLAKEGISERRIGIITDHDRNNQPAYSNREATFYGNVLLPPNVRLHYATTDAATSKGTEDVSNFLLGLCEKRAKDVLTQLEASGKAELDDRVIGIDEIGDVGAETVDAGRWPMGGVVVDWREREEGVPPDLRQRLETGAERIRRVRAAIVRDAKVGLMPPVIIDPAVWVNDQNLLVHAVATLWPANGGFHEIGVIMAAGPALCDDEASLRKLLVHEFAHCFMTATRVINAIDEEINGIDLRGDPADENRERAMLVDPADWLGPADGAIAGWEDRLLEGCTEELQRLVDSEQLLLTAPPGDVEGKVLVPTEWGAHIRKIRQSRPVAS